MSNVTLYGFPRSTFVKVCGLILTARNVDYRFHDTEDEMYLPVHLERHPFGRVPALQHDDFMLYETNAIAAYIDDVFPGPKLTPADPKQARADEPVDRQSQLVLLSGDDLPRVARANGLSGARNPGQRPHRAARHAQGDPRAGGHGKGAVRRPAVPLGDTVTMADYFLLPTLFGFALTPEGKQILPKFPAVVAWDNRMDALPSVVAFNAKLPPRAPIQHAREWVHHHRPAA